MSLDTTVLLAVIAARFLVPLAIPRFPLPALIAALVIDAVDQTIFQAFTDGRLEGYQGYDKALDVYYLTVAYISTLRNWSDRNAFTTGRFLWYYRLAGVLAFELTQYRALLLIFPNTFEYFFIFYEAVRVGWDPRRLSRGPLIGAAAGIWIVIKLPQEYWIHIAQLDVTDIVGENPWLWAVFAVIAVGGATALRVAARSLPPRDHALAVEVVADPGAGLAPRIRRRGWGVMFDRNVLEKSVLVSMVSVIFAQILPDVEASVMQLSVAVAFVVVANAAASQWLAMRGVSWQSAFAEFLAMSVVNLGLVVAYAYLLRRYEGSLNLGATIFFVLLLTLLVTLFDRYRSLRDAKLEDAGDARGTATPVRT